MGLYKEHAIREWTEGESLDDLVIKDIAKFCNVSDMIDGNFVGLYDGKDRASHVIYSRTLEPGHKGILSWRLSGKGHVRFNKFLFDAFNEGDNFKLVEEGTAKYLNVNNVLIGSRL